MDLKDYIICLYDIGINIDSIVDKVYDKLNNSYQNRYTKAYAYISFGKVTHKECRQIVMSTILEYVRQKEDSRTRY